MAPIKEKGVAGILKFIKDNNIEFVDIRFTDLLGRWQHFTFPADQIDESSFLDGIGFDGSSITGFQAINESDMLVRPDPSTAFLDPFSDDPTIVLIGDIADPVRRAPYSRDPRGIAKKAEKFLIESGIATTCYFGPEVEFFIFDDVRFSYEQKGAFFFIDSIEAIWNSGKEEEPNLGYKIKNKQGYFPAPPQDKLHNLRAKMVKVLKEAGLVIEMHHHEVATAGQAEIDIKFDTLLRSADNLMKMKYLIRNTAYRYGKSVTFMPKPLFGDNGTGMHVHQSLWRDKENLFAGNGYALLSDIGRWYIGGLIKHAWSVFAFSSPSTNSYKRLVPGFEAPVYLIYSARNRSACIRIPTYSQSPKARRIEFRSPDLSSNPYLAFSAMLMAGLDGIINKIEPPEPIDDDLYELPEEEKAKILNAPESLKDALIALEKDNDFLKRGNVFTEDLIEKYLELKWEEVRAIEQRPHPYEYFLYYDL